MSPSWVQSKSCSPSWPRRVRQLELAHAMAKHQPAADGHDSGASLWRCPTSAFSHHWGPPVPAAVLVEAPASGCVGSQTRAAAFMASVPQALLEIGTPTAPPPESASRASRTARPSTQPGKAARRDSRPTCDRSRGQWPRALAHLHGALEQPLLMPQAGPNTTRGSARSRRSATARLHYVEDRPSLGRGLAGCRCRRSHQNPPGPTARGGPPPPQASSQPTALRH